MRKILVALLGLLLCASLASADTLFPNSPTTGQIYNFNGTGVLYQYDGAKWVTTGTTSPSITKQTFTTSGTYTPSSGMQYAIIECVGAGGGGGGASGAVGYELAGSGGGGGGYSRAYVTAAQVGASQAVTVSSTGGTGGSGAAAGNAGGDSSVGTLCVGKGGSGGGYVSNTTINGDSAGGAASSGTGDVKIDGGYGHGTWFYNGGATSDARPFTFGGASYFGGTKSVLLSACTKTDGTTGNTYGSGGTGGFTCGTTGGSTATGGTGGGGLVVITEFLSSSWGGPLPQIVNPQGRLTTATATPVPTSDQTSITTVYYTPYKGSYAPLWNGTQFTPVYFNEISAAMGSNWAANSNYDWFLYNDSGTLRICTGPAWTSDTARGTGAATTELELKQGIYANKNSMTCRYSNSATVTVAADYGLYLGTMRTTGSTGTTQIKFGSSAAGGGEAWFGLWNQYNRVRAVASVVDSTATWTYATTTIRSADNSATNRVSLVRGFDEDGVRASYTDDIQPASTAGSYGRIGVGLDATNAYATNSNFGQCFNPVTATMACVSTAHYSGLPGLGFHYLQALELGQIGTTTYNGAAQLFRFEAELTW